MNKRLLALSCAACIICHQHGAVAADLGNTVGTRHFSCGVEAATLGAIQGKVLVNRGGGYETVRGATNLDCGDTVMAQRGGSAQIVYHDGCVVPVEEGAVVAVGEASPCVRLGWLEVPEIPREFLIGVGVMGAIAGAALIWGDSDSDQSLSK
jgi:hypothetical protein